MTTRRKRELPHVAKLRRMGACLSARRFASEYRTLTAAWRACTNVDWMEWYLLRKSRPIAPAIAQVIARDPRILGAFRSAANRKRALACLDEWVAPGPSSISAAVVRLQWLDSLGFEGGHRNTAAALEANAARLVRAVCNETYFVRIPSSRVIDFFMTLKAKRLGVDRFDLTYRQRDAALRSANALMLRAIRTVSPRPPVGDRS